MSEPDRFVELTDPIALRAYAHPVRLSLVGLLRREGPLTATQAGALLDESVPTCSFHLRQLAKYGLVERAPGADGRERPWRATARATTWANVSDDPEAQAAVDHLEAVIIGRYYERAMQWLERRDQEAPEWRRVTGPSDALVFLTAAELADLSRRTDELLAQFAPRQTDPSQRPTGARPVMIAQYVITAP